MKMTQFLNVVLAVLMGMGPASAHAHAPDLVCPEMLKIYQGVSLELFGQCPPRDCLIVSLGSASTVLDSFLRVRAKASGTPLRYVYEIPYGQIVSLGDWQNRPDHFLHQRALQKMLPEKSEIAGRDIIFLRSLNQGFGMRQVFGDLVRYFETVVPREKMGAVFLVTEPLMKGSAQEIIENEKLGAFSEVFVAPEILPMVNRGLVRSADGKPVRFADPIEAYHRYQPIDLGYWAGGFGEGEVDEGLRFIENQNYKALDSFVQKSMRMRCGKAILGVKG